MIPTIKLTLANGARFELPANAIDIVEERPGEEKGCAIGYNLGAGVSNQQLNDQYGFVKKQAIDAGGIANPIELTAVGADGETRLVTLSRSRIVARMEILDGANGINATLTIAAGAGSFPMHVADTLDQMDGIESPAAKRRAKA